MKFMAINAVAVLQNHLFCILKQRDKKDNTWKQFNLSLIRHPWQKNPSLRGFNSFQDAAFVL